MGPEHLDLLQVLKCRLTPLVKYNGTPSTLRVMMISDGNGLVRILGVGVSNSRQLYIRCVIDVRLDFGGRSRSRLQACYG